MPIISDIQTTTAGGYWACWEITESEEELKQIWDLPLTDYFEGIKVEMKRKEWLASRILVKKLSEQVCGSFNGIEKDSVRKPFLIEHSAHISLSHTHSYAAAILHPSQPTGIDIEKISDKVERIAHKYMNDAERAITHANMEEMTIYWSAKEAMYKLNGRKGIIFKEQLLVYKPLEAHNFRGEIILKNLKIDIDLSLHKIDKHVIVCASAII